MLELIEARRTFHAGTADERPALDGVNLTLTRGDFCVVIGSNGAGKTTLLNAIAGAVRLDAGAVRIDNVDVTRDGVERRAAAIARVFQDPMLGTAAAMTVEENLVLAELRGSRPSFRAALTPARRAAYRDRLASLGLGLETRLGAKVGQLSGGQRQALALLMASLVAPKLLLLDEHTAALDPRTAAIVLDATVRLVSESGLTALMVTHNMRHAIDLGNRLAMMERGKIKLMLSGDEKQRMSVEDLVARFDVADDKILLAGHAA